MMIDIYVVAKKKKKKLYSDSTYSLPLRGVQES